jgi:hypothetical protein
MKTRTLKARKAARRPSSKDLNMWWNWEDKESNHDMDAHAASLLMRSDTPMSQMDEIERFGF